MLLGKNVRLLRNAKGWEQKDPSAKSGVAIGAISAILLAQLLPPVNDAGGELRAVLRHQNQAVTLVQHVLRVRIAVVGELLHRKGSNHTLFRQPVGADLDVAVLLFKKLRDFAAGHG